MDCCNYGALGAGWESGYTPTHHYAPYAHSYYAPHAHDPYATYYRYDYPHHAHRAEHLMPMDYGVYASKETRVRRALARRDARAHTPLSHLPLPPTPPLECGINGRGPGYCDPPMWSHYQMSVVGGGGWGNTGAASAWSQVPCSREAMRYPVDCRPIKSSHNIHAPNPPCPPDGRSTPYPMYEESNFSGQRNRRGNPNDFQSAHVPQEAPQPRERCAYPEIRRAPPEEKRPPVVPLPAFQQAFGSTEIGKFAEAFSRTEIAHGDVSNDFGYESFPDWDGPTEQWPSQATTREIKCEDTF